jgi:hypothetical protein
MEEKFQELGWKYYGPDELMPLENRYQTPEGEWLFLYEHPVTTRLGGVRLSKLDPLRQDFAFWLRERLFDALKEPAARRVKLQNAAERLYRILCQSPAPHPWLSLPADSRPQRNRSTLAYHSLLVSAFACAMARAWELQGQSIAELLRFQPPVGEEEIPVELAELMNFIRVGSLCHDFGKHPPQRHNERGKAQVQELFFGILEDMVAFDLGEVAHRHHTARSYRERGESPIGILEELIAHADTLASATDRPILSQDPDPVRAVTNFFRDYLGGEKALSLISADTDRVKSYVFETSRLPEVRGASAQLTTLNEREIKAQLWNDFQLPAECLLYAAGGSALIVAPTKIAAQIAEGIQQLYLSGTRVATISVVHRPTGPREWVKGVEASGNDFGALVKQMGYHLRRAKESRAFHPSLYAPPHSRRCDSCEMRPAVTTEPDTDGREAFLCTVCTGKRKYGRGQKSLYLQQFEEFLGRTDGKATDYGGHWRKVGKGSQVGAARDLDEIGEAAQGKAKGYVGVIYTDGNDIGHRIEESRTPAEYRTLSEELRRATTLATFRALAQQSLLKKVNRTDLETQWVHAFEIVAIGGDDVFLIVAADVALEIACTLCGEFEHEFNGKMTMSAGVLIMPAHLPMYYAREIVETLLKNAKRAGRRDRGTLDISPAYIDFQILTGDTSLSTDLEDFRRQVYVGRSSLEDWQRLTERPHTLTRLSHLLDVVRWAKQEGFPPSQLYQLRQAVVEHIPLWSQNWYRYQLARDEQNQRNGWRAFHKQLFGTCLPAVAEAPWRPIEAEQDTPISEHATPIIDLVEVFDFVRYEGGGGSGSQD